MAEFETARDTWVEKKLHHYLSQRQIKSNAEAALHRWQELKGTHEKAEEERAEVHEQRLLSDSSYMGCFLEEELSKLSWPREDEHLRRSGRDEYSVPGRGPTED